MKIFTNNHNNTQKKTKNTQTAQYVYTFSNYKLIQLVHFFSNGIGTNHKHSHTHTHKNTTRKTQKQFEITTIKEWNEFNNNRIQSKYTRRIATLNFTLRNNHKSTQAL